MHKKKHYKLLEISAILETILVLIHRKMNRMIKKLPDIILIPDIHGVDWIDTSTQKSLKFSRY